MCQNIDNAPIPQFAQCFIDGMYETIKTMTGFELSPKDIINESSSREVAAAMLLSSNKNSMIMISTSISTAAVLIAYMTGIDIREQTESDIYDGVAELVNMVAGLAKAKNPDPDAAFMLTPPFAFVGENINLITKKNVKRYEYSFGSNEVELRLGIYNF